MNSSKFEQLVKIPVSVPKVFKELLFASAHIAGLEGFCCESAEQLGTGGQRVSAKIQDYITNTPTRLTDKKTWEAVLQSVGTLSDLNCIPEGHCLKSFKTSFKSDSDALRAYVSLYHPNYEWEELFSIFKMDLNYKTKKAVIQFKQTYPTSEIGKIFEEIFKKETEK
jgi:hypothetical protein